MTFDKIEVAHGTHAEWTASERILGEGEPGYADDRGVLKFGNGISRWRDLPAVGASLQGIDTVKRLTRAEYDALPTPRPSTTLYIITA